MILSRLRRPNQSAQRLQRQQQQRTVSIAQQLAAEAEAQRIEALRAAQRECLYTALQGLLISENGRPDKVDATWEELGRNKTFDQLIHDGRVVLVNLDNPDDVIYPNDPDGLMWLFGYMARSGVTDPNAERKWYMPALQREVRYRPHYLPDMLHERLMDQLTIHEPYQLNDIRLPCANMDMITALKDAFPESTLYVAEVDTNGATYPEVPRGVVLALEPYAAGFHDHTAPRIF